MIKIDAEQNPGTAEKWVGQKQLFVGSHIWSLGQAQFQSLVAASECTFWARQGFFGNL
jgi:hypothetical protein